MTELSSVIRNCAEASVSSTIPVPATALSPPRLAFASLLRSLTAPPFSDADRAPDIKSARLKQGITRPRVRHKARSERLAPGPVRSLSYPPPAAERAAATDHRSQELSGNAGASTGCGRARSDGRRPR